MIRSMTGYATAEEIADDITISADVRSYNSRHLDIVLRVPTGYSALEDKIKGIIAERIVRGRVEVKVLVRDESDEGAAFEIDRSRAKAVHAVLKQLKNDFNLENDISVEHLLSVGGIIKPAEPAGQIDSIWAATKECLGRALDELEAMRQKEGNYIAGDLANRLDYIEDCLGEIKNDSKDLLNHYQERLKERIAALTRETERLAAAFSDLQ